MSHPASCAHLPALAALTASAALALLAVAGPARASVSVVDPAGGPGGAALLQAAIDAAHDGDILLLRPGDYSGGFPDQPTVAGKSLALVVDGPPGSVVLSALALQTAPLDQVLLRGLHVAAPLGPPQLAGAVWVVGNGRIWLEDCVLTGSAWLSSGPGGDHYVSTSGLTAGPATLVRCTITGGDGPDEVPGVTPPAGGAAAAVVRELAPAVHECVLQGGRGGDGDPLGARLATSHGGPALVVVAGSGAEVLGSSLLGGDEGKFNSPNSSPGAGLAPVFTTVSVRDAEIHAGVVNGAGTPYPDIDLSAGAVVVYPAAVRGLSMPSPVREGDDVILHAHGVVGDAVFAHVSFAQGAQPVPAAQGNYVLGAALASPIFLGRITDPSGTLERPVHVPPLPTGESGRLVFLQSAVAPAGGGLVLGSGTALVWIDATL